MDYTISRVYCLKLIRNGSLYLVNFQFEVTLVTLQTASNHSGYIKIIFIWIKSIDNWDILCATCINTYSAIIGISEYLIQWTILDNSISVLAIDVLSYEKYTSPQAHNLHKNHVIDFILNWNLSLLYAQDSLIL